MNKIKEKVLAAHAKIRGWRTVILNVIVGTPGVLDLLGTIDMQTLFGDKAKTYYGLVLVLLNIYMRYVTVSAIGQKPGA
jgi:hypothetical protein